MAAHNEFGKNGEEAAVRYLLRAGYKVLVRNYRYQRDEIDIIASHEDLCIFVEVKSRTKTNIQQPEQAVTKAKQQRIIKVANHYLASFYPDREARFDIITITPSRLSSEAFEVNHITDAFIPQW